MIDEERFTAIALHQGAIDLASEPVKLKIFGRDDEPIDEDAYYESFFNVDLPKPAHPTAITRQIQFGLPGRGRKASNVLLKSKNMRYLALMLILNLLSGCVTNKLPESADTPSAVTDQFMRELFKSDRDLLRDEEFKQRYFSQRFLRSIEKAHKRAASNSPPEYEPSADISGYHDRFNTPIFNAWDIPTSYTIGAAEQAATTATVQVTFLWGSDTQYPGDTRVTSVQLVAEGGSWRIDDLVTRKGEFVPEGSLRTSLETKKENKNR